MADSKLHNVTDTPTTVVAGVASSVVHTGMGFSRCDTPAIPHVVVQPGPDIHADDLPQVSGQRVDTPSGTDSAAMQAHMTRVLPSGNSRYQRWLRAQSGQTELPLVPRRSRYVRWLLAQQEQKP